MKNYKKFALVLSIIITATFIILKLVVDRNISWLEYNTADSPISFNYPPSYTVTQNLVDFDLSSNSTGDIKISTDNFSMNIQISNWIPIDCEKYSPCENPYLQYFTDINFVKQLDFQQKPLSKSLSIDQDLSKATEFDKFIYEKEESGYSEIIKISNRFNVIITYRVVKDNVDQITKQQYISDLVKIIQSISITI